MDQTVYDTNCGGRVNPADVANTAVNAKNADFDKNGTYTLIHSKSGMVHTLASSVPTSVHATVVLKAMGNYVAGDGFKIAIYTYTAKPNRIDTDLPTNAFIAGGHIQRGGRISGYLGILAIPVLLLLFLNIVDYTTGLAEAKYRNKSINSYKGI